MKVIKIFAGPEDCEKLFKRVIPFRQSSFGRRRQVAGDDVGRRWPRYRTEIIAAAQVGRRIDLRRVLVKVWDPSREEFGIGTGAVAAIAVGLSVDNVAT
jgi:hypothetical protein